mgnify:CR=1 FL=1
MVVSVMTVPLAHGATEATRVASECSVNEDPLEIEVQSGLPVTKEPLVCWVSEVKPVWLAPKDLAARVVKLEIKETRVRLAQKELEAHLGLLEESVCLESRVCKDPEVIWVPLD